MKCSQEVVREPKLHRIADFKLTAIYIEVSERHESDGEKMYN